MALSSQAFQRAAKRRLAAAEFLLSKGKNQHNLDAVYLAGYAVECSLKALILHMTPAADKSETLKKITVGKKMHSPEILGELLKTLGSAVPAELAKRLRLSGWSTDLRYKAERRSAGESRGFLKVVRKTYDWVEGQLP